MATQGANTANTIIAGFSKLNFKKNEVKGKQTFPAPPQRRRKLSQMLPTLDESLTASILSAEGFSLEFDPAHKPRGNSLEQSQNTLATVDCSESSEFFSYHSDGEDEIITEIHPSSPVQASLDSEHAGIQTPKCSEVFDLLYPGSPMAKRRKRATLPKSVQLGVLEAIPRPPLIV